MFKGIKRFFKRRPRAKTSWGRWLEDFGADRFFHSFMSSAQDAESWCINCGKRIYLDIFEGEGVPDWRTHDGDYGCSDSPDTCDEGTGGHEANKDTYTYPSKARREYDRAYPRDQEVT